MSRNLFRLGHTTAEPCYDVRNSLGVHTSPSGEPCSQYRDPGNPDHIIHVVWLDVDGVEVELRAVGKCPAPSPATIAEAR